MLTRNAGACKFESEVRSLTFDRLEDALERRCDPHGMYTTKMERINEILHGKGEMELKDLTESTLKSKVVKEKEVVEGEGEA